MTPAEWEQARSYVCRRYASQAGDDAEDIAQTACLRALLAERRGQTVNPGYVSRAAATLLIDHWRARGRAPCLSAETWPGLVEKLGDHSGTDDLVAQSESREVMQGILARCTPRQRRVLELRAEGYRFQEIAEQIGSSQDSVKKAILRVRRREGRPPRTRSTAWSAGASI